MRKIPEKIRLFASDVDGTLTDGGMYYTESGEYMKRFNTRDAKGLELLRKAGVIVAIVTQENSPIVLARAQKMNIEHVYLGAADKVSVFEELWRKLDIGPAETAYVGDDVNDLAIIKKVGLSFAVADAEPEVAAAAQVHLTRAGGHGAVREAANFVLQNKLF